MQEFLLLSTNKNKHHSLSFACHPCKEDVCAFLYPGSTSKSCEICNGYGIKSLTVDEHAASSRSFGSTVARAHTNRLAPRRRDDFDSPRCPSSRHQNRLPISPPTSGRPVDRAPALHSLGHLSLDPARRCHRHLSCPSGCAHFVSSTP